jgi:hypothetical protein
MRAAQGRPLNGCHLYLTFGDLSITLCHGYMRHLAPRGLTQKLIS